MIDSSDQERIPLAKECINQILNDEELIGIPLLVFANKSDIATISLEELKRQLGLLQIKNRQYEVFPSNAMTGTGLQEGFDWLARILS